MAPFIFTISDSISPLEKYDLSRSSYNWSYWQVTWIS